MKGDGEGVEEEVYHHHHTLGGLATQKFSEPWLPGGLPLSAWEGLSWLPGCQALLLLTLLPLLARDLESEAGHLPAYPFPPSSWMWSPSP